MNFRQLSATHYSNNRPRLAMIPHFEKLPTQKTIISSQKPNAMHVTLYSAHKCSLLHRKSLSYIQTKPRFKAFSQQNRIVFLDIMHPIQGLYPIGPAGRVCIVFLDVFRIVFLGLTINVSITTHTMSKIQHYIVVSLWCININRKLCETTIYLKHDNYFVIYAQFLKHIHFILHIT